MVVVVGGVAGKGGFGSALIQGSKVFESGSSESGLETSEGPVESWSPRQTMAFSKSGRLSLCLSKSVQESASADKYDLCFLSFFLFFESEHVLHVIHARYGKHRICRGTKQKCSSQDLFSCTSDIRMFQAQIRHVQSSETDGIPSCSLSPFL